MVTIKSNLDSDIRRFPLSPPTSFAALTAALTKCYGEGEFTLQYADEDGDHVTVSSDDELKMAVEAAGNGLVRITVTRKGGGGATAPRAVPVDAEALTAAGSAPAASAAAAAPRVNVEVDVDMDADDDADDNDVQGDDFNMEGLSETLGSLPGLFASVLSPLATGFANAGMYAGAGPGRPCGIGGLGGIGGFGPGFGHGFGPGLGRGFVRGFGRGRGRGFGRGRGGRGWGGPRGRHQRGNHPLARLHAAYQALNPAVIAAFRTLHASLSASPGTAALFAAAPAVIPAVTAFLSSGIGHAGPVPPASIDALLSGTGTALRAAAGENAAGRVEEFVRMALGDASVVRMLRLLSGVDAEWVPGADAARAGASAASSAAAAASASGRRVPTPTLSFGAEGPEVAWLQSLLTDAGFMEPGMYAFRAGMYGPHTAAAVNAFRGAYGLGVQGTYGVYDEVVAASLLSLLEAGVPPGSATGAGAGAPASSAGVGAGADSPAAA